MEVEAGPSQVAAHRRAVAVVRSRKAGEIEAEAVRFHPADHLQVTPDADASQASPRAARFKADKVCNAIATHPINQVAQLLNAPSIAVRLVRTLIRSAQTVRNNRIALIAGTSAKTWNATAGNHSAVTGFLKKCSDEINSATGTAAIETVNGGTAAAIPIETSGTASGAAAATGIGTEIETGTAETIETGIVLAAMIGGGVPTIFAAIGGADLWAPRYHFATGGGTTTMAPVGQSTALGATRGGEISLITGGDLRLQPA